MNHDSDKLVVKLLRGCLLALFHQLLQPLIFLFAKLLRFFILNRLIFRVVGIWGSAGLASSFLLTIFVVLFIFTAVVAINFH